MIKFFRHIRQRLLKEGKTTRYLTYALGEIILVVIGILIALSINNWNQNRIEAKKEGAYLENIERDLNNQLTSIAIQLSFEQKYLDLATPLLEQVKATGKLLVDSSSSRRLDLLTERKTFVRTDPTYEELISTGNIALLRNRDLRNSLIEYYQELERYEKIIQNNNTLLVDELYVHKIIDYVYIGSMSSERFFDVSNELLMDREHAMKLTNLVEYRYKMANLHIRFMNELKEKTIAVIAVMKETYPVGF